jgi:hypothetical protein
LRVPGGAFAGDQQKIAHVDSGAKNPRWGQFRHDLTHDSNLQQAALGAAIDPGRPGATPFGGTGSPFNRYHGSSPFGEEAFLS